MKSATHSRFGATAVNRRFTRSSARGWVGSATVVRTRFLFERTVPPHFPHQSFDGTSSYLDTAAAQHNPGLPRTENPCERLPRPEHVNGIDDMCIGQYSGTRQPSDMVVVRGRGDVHAMLGEHRAHRVDTPDKTIGTHPVSLVSADEVHNYRCGRSISAAKKADAALSIPLARLSSAFS